MKALARPALAALLAACTAVAMADDGPKRRSGLWEIRNQVAGAPAAAGAQAFQVCVDQAADRLVPDTRQRGADCPVADVRHSGNSIAVHLVCRQGDTTVTTDSTLSGNFDNAYRNELRIRFDPPQNGIAESRVVQEARWIGPCKAGQRPGQIVIPGVGKR